MFVTVLDEGRPHRVECPDGSRVYRNGDRGLEDTLAFACPDAPDGVRYLPEPVVLHCARSRSFGLRLAEDLTTDVSS